ncbi:hypothetical protein [uncultured Tateyamaria sp.]|uniref:hypothetical protein n=1 Tax=uncultured Tateyamaria sp. TaxID=455651 RepID=UPI0026195C53|nr:hypothetical protein [uncultured Tateyamaria sp.]
MYASTVSEAFVPDEVDWFDIIWIIRLIHELLERLKRRKRKPGFDAPVSAHASFHGDSSFSGL